MIRARRRFAPAAPPAPARSAFVSRYRPLLEGLERRELLATLVVKTTPGPGEYGTITSAVAAAAANDTVLVHPGTYNESNILIDKALIVRSVAGAATTIVNGSNASTADAGIFIVEDTTGNVTIGGVNAGFTLQNPPTANSGVTVGVLVSGNTAPVTVQENTIVGRNGVSDPFDIGLWAYSTKAGGTINLQDNTFTKMWQGTLLELPLGGVNVQGNTFNDLKTSTFAGDTYESQGVFVLSYGGPAFNVSGVSISGNTFTNFSGLSISVSGGYPNFAASRVSNVQITNNLIDAIGFLDVGFRSGILLINDADTAGDAVNGGVHNANVQGNTITTMTDCSAGTRGVWVLGRNDSITIRNNFISSFDEAVAIDENLPGTGYPTNVSVTRNSLTNNVKGVVNLSPSVVNVEFNWWGTTNAPLVKALANGGTNVDYNPFLGSATDTSIAPGFQPDLANLVVDSLVISGDDSVVKNTVYTLGLNTLALPAGVPLTSWTINWGDATIDPLPGASTFANHTYTAAGNYVITATASDGTNTYKVANTVNVAVTDFATLQAVRVTPNPSGFSVRFNQPIDTNVLNLYSSALAANTAGPADVTLVGNSTGPVTGSLVIDPDFMGFTFVKTGSPLATDTYTVTLRSDAVNGIRTGGGSALDGDANGVAGGNFTTTFNTTLAARTVSLPDFMRGPGQPVVVPAATGNSLPISVSNSSNIVTLDLVIAYDPTKLTVNGATLAPGLPAGTSLAINNLSPGVLILCLRSPSPLGPGINELIRLAASVPNGAGYTTKEAIRIQSASINDGGIGVTGDSAMHVVGYLGDTNGNGSITASDASLISRVVVLLDSGFSGYQVADPLIIGDINASGGLSASDASLVSRFVVLIPTPQIPPIPFAPTIVAGFDPMVSLPRDLKVTAGGAVSVPVNLTHTDVVPVELGVVDLAVSYDPAAFMVKGVSPGSLTGGFKMLWTVDEKSGLIVISSERLASPVGLAPGDTGTLAVIELVARPGAALGKQSLNLLDSVLAGGGARETRLNDGRLLLVPAPTNADDDPVDGLITVVRAKGKDVSPVSAAAGQGALAVDAALESFPLPGTERRKAVESPIVVIPPAPSEPLEVPFRARGRRWPAQSTVNVLEKMRGLAQ